MASLVVAELSFAVDVLCKKILSVCVSHMKRWPGADSC